MSEPDQAPGSFARAFTSLSLASGVSMGANLVRGKLAALFLGPAGVGIFNQLSLMWNLFQISGSLGAFNGLIQHGTEAMVAKDEAALHRLASTWWILLTGFSCLLSAAGAFASPTISNWLLGDHGAHANLVALMLISIPFAASSQIYRALLAAARLVPQLVRAQIVSDVGGAIVFAALVPVLGLPGSILGFATIHLLFYLITAFSVRKTLGSAFIRPRLSAFSWAVVRSNVAFGASGLAMVVLANVSILLVSRIIIGRLGLEASGIFSNSWRILSSTLTPVMMTSLYYYMPTLSRSTENNQTGRDVNDAVQFYLYLLPPMISCVMIASEVIIGLVLSSKFLQGAPLLIVFGPGELIRIITETISVVLLSRRCIRMFTLLYVIQAATFVGFAAAFLPSGGLMGAAAAYCASNILACLAAYVFVRRHFGIRMEPQTLQLMRRAAILLGLVGAISAMFPWGSARLSLTGAVMAMWCLITAHDERVRHSFSRISAKVVMYLSLRFRPSDRR